MREVGVVAIGEQVGNELLAAGMDVQARRAMGGSDAGLDGADASFDVVICTLVFEPSAKEVICIGIRTVGVVICARWIDGDEARCGPVGCWCGVGGVTIEDADGVGLGGLAGGAKFIDDIEDGRALWRGIKDAPEDDGGVAKAEVHAADEREL